MSKPLIDQLANADKDTLAEILREAEARLNAQLSTALAADLRAMTFLGFVVTALAVVMGGTIAIVRSDAIDFWLVSIGLFAVSGLGAAAWYAFDAAKPIEFHMVGNYPSEWVTDVSDGKPLNTSLAELCAHYDSMLVSNRAAMASCGDTLIWSSGVAIGTIFVGGFLAITRLLFMAAAQTGLF